MVFDNESRPLNSCLAQGGLNFTHAPSGGGIICQYINRRSSGFAFPTGKLFAAKIRAKSGHVRMPEQHETTMS